MAATLLGEPSASQIDEAGPNANPVVDWRLLWVFVPLAVLVLLAYWPVLSNGFVSWDDESNFLANPYFRGLGLEPFKWAWSTFWLGAYQPLAWLILEVEYALWGLNPSGYHLASVLMHIANACALCLLTLSVLARCLPDLYQHNRMECYLAAGLPTALHAVHPLRVEVVAWASCQPYLPCALFFMLSVLAYLEAFPQQRSPRRVWLARSFFLFAAALLCKAVAVSLPVVLLILDYYPLKRLGGGPGRWFGRAVWRVWIEKIPFLVLSVIFMDVAIVAKDRSPNLLTGQALGIFTEQIAQACYGIWFYLVKTFVPVNIVAFYPLPARITWYEYPFIVCILATLGTSIVLFLLRARCPGLFAAWLVYLVILTPNLGIVQISHQIAADRYSYLPLMSGTVVLSAGLCLLLHRRTSSPFGIGLTAVSLATIAWLIALTWNQCRTWKNTEALWTHALSNGRGRSAEVYNFMGKVRAKQGVRESAIALYQESLQLNPRYEQAHNNLGVCLAEQGRFDEAMEHFSAALAIRPQFAEARMNVGSVMAKKGRLEEAVNHYVESIETSPEYALAHKNLGKVLLKLGRTREAVKHHAEALWLDPGDPEADNIVGNVLLRYGDLGGPAASASLSRLALDPHDSGARQGLIDALREHDRGVTSR